MGLLNFLQGGNVTEVTATAPKSSGAKKQWQPNPVINAVRLWKDGSVFPSTAAIAKFDLDYRSATITKEDIAEIIEQKDPTGKVLVKGRAAGSKNVYAFPEGTGNGLDVISSKEWAQFGSNTDGAMVFVSVVPKSSPKVDLFGSTTFDETGTPKSTVAEQGAATFGSAVLIPMVQDIYGIKFGTEEGEVEFIDLMIFESLGKGDQKMEITERFSRPIMNFPKRVTRGEGKGSLDYVRRENCKVYGFAPMEMVYSATADTRTEAIADVEIGRNVPEVEPETSDLDEVFSN